MFRKPKPQREIKRGLESSILPYIEDASNARDTPYTYVTYVWSLIELYNEWKSGDKYVLQGRSEQEIERIRQTAIEGMNNMGSERGYRMKIVTDASQKGIISACPEVAVVLGKHICFYERVGNVDYVHDEVRLQVKPDPTITDLFTFKIHYRDGIKLRFPVNDENGKPKEEITVNTRIKSIEKTTEEAIPKPSIDEIKKLTTYADRAAQQSTQTQQ